jgi:hypothetical protein
MSVTDIVNTWFTENCGGGPLARDTEAYNQVVTALPDLIARLAAASAPAPAEKTKT